MKKSAGLLICLYALAVSGYGQSRTAISGSLDWTTMEIRASVSLDLARAGISIPGGRNLAEEILRAEYPPLIRPFILSLPVDSSGVLADLVDRGEFSLARTDEIAAAARIVPPALSPDLAFLKGSYTVSITRLSAALIRHRSPADLPRLLLPVPAASYTGIVILAQNELPVHGRNSAALARPCLFPKIWDSEMNLIYEKNILDPEIGGKAPMVSYAPPESVFQTSPSGLDPALAELVGENPLRILARGVFGILPTDPVIDREDALLILSSEANRRLLREGRVVIVLNSAVLTSRF